MSFDPGNWILKKLQLKVPKDMLIAQLQHDPDIMGRIYAAEALGEIGSLEAVASLRQVLEQETLLGRASGGGAHPGQNPYPGRAGGAPGKHPLAPSESPTRRGYGPGRI